MLITCILLIAMLGAIVLATGSVEEDSAPVSVVTPAATHVSSGNEPAAHNESAAFKSIPLLKSRKI